MNGPLAHDLAQLYSSRILQLYLYLTLDCNNLGTSICVHMRTGTKFRCSYEDLLYYYTVLLD
jgi:hypothetical protein